MNYRYIRTTPDAFRVPAAIARYQQQWGFWDGINHVDPEPAGVEPPAPTAATPPNPPSPPAAESLGDNGLKALQEERAARKALEAQLKAFQGIDPDKAAEAMRIAEQHQEFEQQRAQWKAEQEAKLKQQYEPQLQQQQELAAQYQQELANYKLEVALKDAYLSTDGIPEKFKYAKVDLGDRVRLGESGALEVLDADGNPAYVADAGKSRPMTINELIKEMTQKDIAFAGNFKGNNTPGFALNGNGQMSTGNPAFDNLSPWDKVDAIRAQRSGR